MEEIAVKCTVSGRVQGVGYRYWTESAARRLGLAGWVRNEPGGAVEVVLQGRDSVVAEMIGLLEQGPRYARVTMVRTQAVALNPSVTEFEIRY